eukprot:525805-Prymnesium_polylepis.1
MPPPVGGAALSADDAIVAQAAAIHARRAAAARVRGSRCCTAPGCVRGASDTRLGAMVAGRRAWAGVGDGQPRRRGDAGHAAVVRRASVAVCHPVRPEPVGGHRGGDVRRLRRAARQGSPQRLERSGRAAVVLAGGLRAAAAIRARSELGRRADRLRCADDAAFPALSDKATASYTQGATHPELLERLAVESVLIREAHVPRGTDAIQEVRRLVTTYGIAGWCAVYSNGHSLRALSQLRGTDGFAVSYCWQDAGRTL